MSVFIQKMTDDVTLLDGDMPLNQKQIEQLVAIVIHRLEEKKAAEQSFQEMTQLRTNARPI